MGPYRDYNSKYHHSHQYKYPKYVPRHHRYGYKNKNYESRHVHQQHYYRKSNNINGKYDYHKVQTSRPLSSVHWKPTQRTVYPPSLQPVAVPIIEKPEGNNWKLLADPFFGQVSNKIYRVDGIVPNNFSCPEVIVKDPRMFQSKMKVMNLPIELPVPLYTIDNHYIGQRPEVEVTFSNLDDDIDTAFLSKLVFKYGKVELVQIYYHPITKKHLNLAKIIFDDPVAAKSCVLSLNKTSIMGKIVDVFLDPSAFQCKIMYNKMIQEKSKPVPESHKIKLFPTSNKNKQDIKSNESKKESIFQCQTKEKLYPSTINNCTKFYDDHGTTSSTPCDISSIQNNKTLGDNPVFSETHSYPYVRDSCHVPLVPNNHWEVISPVNPLPVPPTELNLDSAKSKSNLNRRIEMPLSVKDDSVEPTFLSMVKKEPDDTLDCKDNIVDDNLNLNLSVQPLVNCSQSNLTAKEMSKEEEMLLLISNPKSPFMYKNIYMKCLKAAVRQLNIKTENEELEAESLFNSTLGNVISNMHESPDSDISFSGENVLVKSPVRNTPDGTLSSSNLLSQDEIIKNDTSIPQCSKLPKCSPDGYQPPQFNNLHGYKFPYLPSCSLPLLENHCKSKLSYDRCENENLPAKLRKKLMAAVVNELRIKIKSDLMEKMITTVAFKTFDECWEEAKRQLKSTSVFNKESKSTQQDLYLDNVLERGTEGLDTLDLGLGLQASFLKMPVFSKKKKESLPKKTSIQLNEGSNQEEMVLSSDSETKSIDEDEVTRFTFAEQKCEGKELFFSDSSISIPDSSHNSSDEEKSSVSSKNEESRNKSKFEKLYKSMKLEDLDSVKELTPAKNDEEGSLIKNKCDSGTVKRKIDDNLNNPVQSKKHLVNGEKTSIEESSSSEFVNHFCSSQQVPDKKTKLNATNKCFKSQLIVNIEIQKIPKLLITKLKRPLTVRDSNKIENIDQLTTQKQSGNEVKTKYFNRRDMAQEANVLYEFVYKGIDVEDINYLKQSYESMLSNETDHCCWLNETRWISHPVTDIPNEVTLKKKNDEWKIHDTGCARTEGYYKVDSKQKANFKYHFRYIAPQLKLTKESTVKILDRETRSHQRKLLTAAGNVSQSDSLNSKVLKFRKKRLRFGKSAIHEWGLFAMENIAADEMVIEYVGQIIRPIVADLREQQYAASGIDSSYLFRIDLNTIVDATKCGNLSRFINHSCNANCYAKVIEMDGQKKIIIFSKQPIFVNEEITYDYKFPLEENKIPCLCGTNCCRGTLN